MIIVTGASGQLGRLVVEQLLGRVPASQLGVSVRDPAKAGPLADRGVRVRRGDFTDAASLAHAFEGATQVLIISAATAGEAALHQHRTAIEAAQAAGARRILYTSHMGASPSSAFAPMVDHASTEAMLEGCGVPFTSLRNGFYAASGLMVLGQAIETGQLIAPEDGPVSWTAHADLAEAAAIALTDPGRLTGLTPPLTASHALTLADLATAASELTGRPITRITVPDAQYRSTLLAHGLPEWRADLLVGMFVASRRGEFARTDPTLAQLLGRPPLRARDALKSRISG